MCLVSSKSLSGVSPANRFCENEICFKRGIQTKAVAAAAGRHVPYVCRSWKNPILAEVMTRANMNAYSSLHPPHLADLFS